MEYKKLSSGVYLDVSSGLLHIAPEQEQLLSIQEGALPVEHTSSRPVSFSVADSKRSDINYRSSFFPATGALENDFHGDMSNSTSMKQFSFQPSQGVSSNSYTQDAFLLNLQNYIAELIASRKQTNSTTSTTSTAPAVSSETVVATIKPGSGGTETALSEGSTYTLDSSETDTFVVKGAQYITFLGGTEDNSLKVENSSGSTFKLGDGANSITLEDSYQTRVLTGSGADTVTLNAHSRDMWSTLSLGDGNNALNITGTNSSIVTAIFGTGDDTVNANIMHSSNLNAGEGSNTLTAELAELSTLLNFNNVTIAKAVDVSLETLTTASRAVSIYLEEARDSKLITNRGHDIITIDSGNNLVIDTRNSNDRVTLSNVTQANVQLGADHDVFNATDSDSLTVFGDIGNDVVTLTNVSNSSIDTDRNDDIITANGISNSTIKGGHNNDVITVDNATNTRIDGGLHNDTITVTGSGTGNTIYGGQGTNTITGSDQASETYEMDNATNSVNNITDNSTGAIANNFYMNYRTYRYYKDGIEDISLEYSNANNTLTVRNNELNSEFVIRNDASGNFENIARLSWDYHADNAGSDFVLEGSALNNVINALVASPDSTATFSFNSFTNSAELSINSSIIASMATTTI